jgi:acyl-CoA synthetase (AMP-forming)/AMP-acid ligase II
MTEADHRHALAHEPALLSSAGRVGAFYDVTIRDPQGKVLPAGEKGEIWIRGPALMNGYLNLPEQTADAMRGEWLCTNDIGRLDSRGYLYLLDRKKFLIISGAVNVFPASVEAVLADHPSVFDVAVVGVPHPDWGEAVVALVQLHAGRSETTSEEVMAFARQRLSTPECPKAVLFVGEIAKSATGKTNKLLMREQLMAGSNLLPWDAQAAVGA